MPAIEQFGLQCTLYTVQYPYQHTVNCVKQHKISCQLSLRGFKNDCVIHIPLVPHVEWVLILRTLKFSVEERDTGTRGKPWNAEEQGTQSLEHTKNGLDRNARTRVQNQGMLARGTKHISGTRTHLWIHCILGYSKYRNKESKTLKYEQMIIYCI